MFQVVVPPVGTHFYQAYFHEAGIIGATTAFDSAAMFYTADSTNVYIQVDKYYDGGSANNIIGTSVKITLFTFIDDYTVS